MILVDISISSNNKKNSGGFIGVPNSFGKVRMLAKIIITFIQEIFSRYNYCY